MTDPTHAVHRRLAHQILPSRRWLDQDIGAKSFGTYHIRSHRPINQRHQSGHRCYHFNLGIHCLWILGSFGREPRAFLATSMLTADANLFGTECCLASVTLTMNSHTDFLFDAFGVATSWRSPFTWLQGQAVLGEHCTRSFLLDGIAFSSSCCDLPSRFLNGFAGSRGRRGRRDPYGSRHF